MAIGSIFCWLLPLVWGWFSVTTQYGRAEDTNTDLETITLRIQDRNNPNTIVESPDQTVFRVRGHIGPDALAPVFTDEQRVGAFYNYARLGTWSFFARNVVHAYGHVQKCRRTFDEDNRPPETTEIVNAAMRAVRVRRRFGFLDSEYEGSNCLRRAISAFMCAFLLQSFTGWSAFLIVYRTPTIGIGCRSFTFLLYNVFSFSSCVFVVLAAYLSDCRSWRSEQNRNGALARTQGIAEAILRFVGKGIAFLNCGLILLSCMLQFIGVYNSCYCGCNVITAGDLGYIVFLSPQAKADYARAGSWSGFIMASMSCLVVIAYFHFSKQDLVPDNQ
jgi:hypothetical protein